MTDKLKVFIGWDPREQTAYEVAEYSLRLNASSGVEVTPIRLDDLKARGILWRPIERTESGKLWCPISQAPMATEFAISRFAVPFMCKAGWALFTDCDMLWQGDVRELFDLADPTKAVMVVKHEQRVLPHVMKMDQQQQTAYSRKNWSSVMLWNLDHPAHQRLSLQMLNELPGRDLHRFCWLEDEEIGALPPEWNVLVDASQPKLLHYTLGGPWFAGYENCEYSQEWLMARQWMEASRGKK